MLTVLAIVDEFALFEATPLLMARDGTRQP
jgi:hypothetical protein